MLRGPEVSSQADEGGCESPAAPHPIPAWICMAARFSSAFSYLLFRLMHTEVAADRLLNYHFFIMPPRRLDPLLPCRILAVAFLQTVAGWCLPGAVTFSLLALAHGKFTKLLVWGEAIKWASDMLLYAHISGWSLCACACASLYVWMLPVKSWLGLNAPEFDLFRSKHYTPDVKLL